MLFFPAQTRGRKAVTLVEIMMGFLILGVMLLTVFYRLNNSVKDVEIVYSEIFALSQAKYAMDVLMFQIPLRCLHQGNPCQVRDPKSVPEVNTLLDKHMPLMFGCADSATHAYPADGIVTDLKGFQYRVRVQCYDIENLDFLGKNNTFTTRQLASLDADGKYCVAKKLVLQVLWASRKGIDPLNDPASRQLFLIGAKYDLD